MFNQLQYQFSLCSFEVAYSVCVNPRCVFFYCVHFFTDAMEGRARRGEREVHRSYLTSFVHLSLSPSGDRKWVGQVNRRRRRRGIMEGSDALNGQEGKWREA